MMSTFMYCMSNLRRISFPKRTEIYRVIKKMYPILQIVSDKWWWILMFLFLADVYF